MDLFEASKQGVPLVVETGEGGDRLVAEIFPHRAGAVFVDTGWPTSTLNPIHALEGRIQEDGDGWLVGDTRIRIAFEGEPLFTNWQAWQKYRAGDGKQFDRDRCRDEVDRLFGADTA